MRLKTFLISCALILTVSSTVFSQITGIPRETKIEIVSTLEAYPIVLEELDIHYRLLSRCDEIKTIFYEQIKLSDTQILKLQQINANNQKQIELLNLQLKKKPKRNWFVPILIGAVGGAVLGISL